MDIIFSGLDARASSVVLEGLLDVADVRASCSELVVRADAAGVAVGGELAVATTVVEAAINRVLGRVQQRPLADLQIALLDGPVRITGRYSVAGPVAVPFELSGRLEIDGGARLRLQTERVSVVGASLPEAMLAPIGERVNAHLAEALDVTRLPIPVRLTRVVVEPGRATLHAAWRIDNQVARPADPGAIDPE